MICTVEKNARNKISFLEAGELAQWLRTLVLAKDPGLTFQYPHGSLLLPWAPGIHVVHRHTLRHKTHTHSSNFKKNSVWHHPYKTENRLAIPPQCHLPILSVTHTGTGGLPGLS